MWRRVRLIVLVALLVLLAAWVGMDLWAGRRLNEEVARLEKRYGSLATRLLRSPARIPAADNRARVARAAAALTVFEFDSEQGRAVERFLAASEQARVVERYLAANATSPAPAEVRAFVETNRPAIRVAEEARARARSSWEADYVSDRNTPGFLDLRELSNAMYLSALIDVQEGRADSAAHAAGTGLVVASTFRDEPSLVAQLIRIALATIQLRATQQVVIRGEPSRGALEDLARCLAENRLPAQVGVGLLGGLRQAHAIWSKLENGHAEAVYDETGNRASWFLGAMAQLNRPIVRLGHARSLQAFGRLLDIEYGPRPRPAFEPAPPPIWMPGLKSLYAGFTAGFARSIDSGDEFASALGAAEIAVALRRFRVDHASYPEDLAALVPAYLSAVPVDPFTGRPMVYARRGAGFELHGEWPKDLGSRLRPRPALLDWVVAK